MLKQFSKKSIIGHEKRVTRNDLQGKNQASHVILGKNQVSTTIFKVWQDFVQKKPRIFTETCVMRRQKRRKNNFFA